MHKNTLLTALFLFMLLSSCSLTYRVLLGVDSTPKWQFAETINKRAKKLDIPDSMSFVLDTASYFNALVSMYNHQLSGLSTSAEDSALGKRLRKVVNDDLQPVQLRVFSADGSEVFKMVNCYIDPPIPMDWNVDGCLDSFPPQTEIENLNTHVFGLAFLLEHMRTTDGKPVNRSDLPKARHYVVVTWNDFFKRPSKRLIKKMKRLPHFQRDDIAILYVNNHNAEIWQELDAQQKSLVSKLEQNE